MTDQTDIIQINDEERRDTRRKAAILRALGLEQATEELRELTLAIARRYNLDPMLRHLEIIDGRPYITRDGLLWIAHRSGQFDGVTVTKPELVGEFWEARATVHRKDMAFPIEFWGRYPAKGRSSKNAPFAPEMAVKVAESMAYRRAFNVSAPSADERWERGLPPVETAQPPTLAERVSQRTAQLRDAREATDQELGEHVGRMLQGQVMVDDPPASDEEMEAFAAENRETLADEDV